MTGVATLRSAYVQQVVATGAITQPRWRAAFATVPRELFAPRFYLHQPGGGMRAVGEDDPDWLPSVYSDHTLVTQLDGDDHRWHGARLHGPITGSPTSSSTQPTLMAWMLEALDPGPNDRVLEVGTGTGYNAALLCHALGAPKVSTIDVDPGVAERAVEALGRAGYHPDVTVADAARGHPAGAPCDHLIATCSWPRVPPAWLDQVRPGGRILTHLYTDLDAGGLLLLTRRHDGTAVGPFLPQYGAFMTRRDVTPPDTVALLRAALRSSGTETRRPAEVAFTELLGEDFPIYAALRVPGVALHWFQPDGAPAMQTWLLDRHGSAAHQEFRDGSLVTVQSGDRRLGDEIDRVHREWTELGGPARHRFGVTVAPDGDRIWLDHPDTGPNWPHHDTVIADSTGRQPPELR